MTQPRFVIALDQGTTSSRAILIDKKTHMTDCVQKPFDQIYPHPGWVEHNPQDILFSQLQSLCELTDKNGLCAQDISALGIDNQRETTIVWDRTSGKPLCNAIVWQCRRTSDMIDELCATPEIRSRIQQKTGLVPDAYYSASKIAWILREIPGARAKAEAGDLLFGTVDTYLIWTLTGGRVHATDYTNASRTMLYNIFELCWDTELLDLFDIPVSMMPEVLPSAGFFGETHCSLVPEGIPICGVAGDQQSALFGHLCTHPGEAKNTFGTGAFMLMHTGETPVLSKNNLITTIAAAPPDTRSVQYALEGSVFVSGALVQWLRDELGIIRDAADTEAMALAVKDTGGVVIVPAFTGLGAPWWDQNARGAIFGLTRGCNRNHLVRAALEAQAYQLKDLADAMSTDANTSIKSLYVDGGACVNNFLMQFSADILKTNLIRPQNIEATAMGAGYLAGLTSGFWSNIDELKLYRKIGETFTPSMENTHVKQLLDRWHDALRRTLL